MAASSKQAGSSTAPAKALDVIAPGKTPPSTSGRPIIVTNRPMIKDPMAPSASATTEPAAMREGKQLGSTLLVPQGETKWVAPIKAPITVDRAPDTAPEPADKPEPVAPGQPAAEEKTEPVAPAKAEPAAATEPTAKPAATTEEAPKSVEPAEASATPAADTDSETSIPEAPSPDVQNADAAQQKIDKEVAEHLAEQEKVIASKQYYLPIKSAGARRGAQLALVILLLVIIASAVWFDLVLDAGILHIGNLHALTHFFKS